MEQKLQTILRTLSQPTEEQKKAPTVQLVIFLLDGEKYGVPIESLKEIVNSSEITPLPNSPDYVKGIINLRGRIVAIIDLKQRLRLDQNTTPEARAKNLIFEVDKDLYAIEIDDVLEIHPVEINAIKPAPPVILNKIKEGQCIQGVVVLESEQQQQIIIIFDLQQLITNN